LGDDDSDAYNNDDDLGPLKTSFIELLQNEYGTNVNELLKERKHLGY